MTAPTVKSAGPGEDPRVSGSEPVRIRFNEAPGPAREA